MRTICPLYYHKISNDTDDFNISHVSINHFEEQISWLKDRFDIIRLENIENELAIEGRDAVAITFDDGYADVFRYALPILKKYGVPATVFITTANIDSGRPNYTESIISACLKPNVYHESFTINDDFIKCSFNTRNLKERLFFYDSIRSLFKHLEPELRKGYENKLYDWAGINDLRDDSKRIMNSSEIKELSECELITIGSHTVNHASLKWISKKSMEYELIESKEILERIIKKEIDVFAYPWGTYDDYSDECFRVLEETGYRRAFTTEGRVIRSDSNPFSLSRWMVYDHSHERFKEYIESIFDCNKDSKRREVLGEAFIEYIGDIENDYQVITGNKKVVIWGYGEYGKKTYNLLSIITSSDRIVAFADNNAEKVGISEFGIPVLSLDQVKHMQENEMIIVIAVGKYNWDIAGNLIEKGIKSIHIIV